MQNDRNSIFRDKTILVTGGTGSIGKEIVLQLLSKKGPKLVKIFSRSEFEHFKLRNFLSSRFPHDKFVHIIGDIRDRQSLDESLKDVDIVVHAAGLKHVTFCEENPWEAIKTNVIGSKNVIDLSMENRVSKVVAISTDKAVYPTTTMGASKLLMEHLFLKYNTYNKLTRFSVVRFGNVLASRGSVVDKWIKSIEEKREIEITDKRMRRFFMSIHEAVGLVLRSLSIMEGGEIFVLKMSEMSINKLAEMIIDKYGRGKDIDIRYTQPRNREKKRERLFADEEKPFMIESKDFYIIKNE